MLVRILAMVDLVKKESEIVLDISEIASVLCLLKVVTSRRILRIERDQDNPLDHRIGPKILKHIRNSLMVTALERVDC